MRATLFAAGTAALLLVSLLGCTTPQTPPAVTPPAQPPTSTPATSTSAEPSMPPMPPASEFVPEITNPWYPLKPGSKWSYSGVKDGEPTVDTFVVTSQKKTILGVPATVVKDTLKSGERVVEDTEDWFAQDAQGNVWYLGEATKSYAEDGSVESTSGSWEAGVDGAKAGIFMPASPAVGMSFYQEYYKGYAEDWFTIVSMTATATVPYGSFHDALKTDERTPLEPDVVAQKFYVKGVGLVFENDVSGPPEFSKLTSYTK